MSTVTVLGTGLLGAGFAQNLLRHGHAVSVWNRTFAKAEALAEHGARPCATAAEAVSGAERVHLVLTADDAVDEVLSSALQTLRAGAWVIDHSAPRTSPGAWPSASRACARKGCATYTRPSSWVRRTRARARGSCCSPPASTRRRRSRRCSPR